LQTGADDSTLRVDVGRRIAEVIDGKGVQAAARRRSLVARHRRARGEVVADRECRHTLEHWLETDADATNRRRGTMGEA
jgi:hypothetical protein